MTIDDSKCELAKELCFSSKVSTSYPFGIFFQETLRMSLKLWPKRKEARKHADFDININL